MMKNFFKGKINVCKETMVKQVDDGRVDKGGEISIMEGIKMRGCYKSKRGIKEEVKLWSILYVCPVGRLQTFHSHL